MSNDAVYYFSPFTNITHVGTQQPSKISTCYATVLKNIKCEKFTTAIRNDTKASITLFFVIGVVVVAATNIKQLKRI